VADPRLSHQTLRVLRVFLDCPQHQGLSGSDMAKQTDLLSGTIYPILARLERSGWLSSKWEKLNPREAGRPRKRLYRLTGIGYNKTNEAFSLLGVPNKEAQWTF
jgi:PadR family transcriptional regulator, regulatory protein PadR